MGYEPSSIIIAPFHGAGRARNAAWRITAELVGGVPGQGVSRCSMDVQVSTELSWLITEAETGHICGAVHE